MEIGFPISPQNLFLLPLPQDRMVLTTVRDSTYCSDLELSKRPLHKVFPCNRRAAHLYTEKCGDFWPRIFRLEAIVFQRDVFLLAFGMTI